MVQDGVAALAEGGLRTEVGDDVHQPVPQVGDAQARWNVLHQPQRVYIAAYMVQQGSCRLPNSLSFYAMQVPYNKAPRNTSAWDHVVAL